mgnify:CR=1 FL=1
MRWIGVCRRAFELMRDRAATRELAAALRSRDSALVLVNAVGEGILQLDGEGRLVRLNPAAARLVPLVASLLLVLATALLMTGLTLFINKTIYGKAMRAISIDMDACRLMGVDVNKIIGLTFFVGSALAAAATAA